MVIDCDSGSAQSCQVGTSARFRQREARQSLAVCQARQEATFLLGIAKSPNRIDGADAAVYRGQSGRHRIVGSDLSEEAAEAGERRPLAPITFFDEHSPITGRRQFVEQLLGELAFLV